MGLCNKVASQLFAEYIKCRRKVVDKGLAKVCSNFRVCVRSSYTVFQQHFSNRSLLCVASDHKLALFMNQVLCSSLSYVLQLGCSFLRGSKLGRRYLCLGERSANSQGLCQLPSDLQQEVLAASQVPLLIQLYLLPAPLHSAALHATHPSIHSTSYISVPFGWGHSKHSSAFWKVLAQESSLKTLHCFPTARKRRKVQIPPPILDLFTATARRLTNLESLSISGLSLGGLSVSKLLSVMSPRNLQHLDISDNDICRQAGAQSLMQPLAKLTALSSLNLAQNSLKDDGFHAIGDALSQLTLLQYLNLSCCDISELGSDDVSSHVSPCTSLKELRYSGNVASGRLMTFLCGLSALECLHAGSSMIHLAPYVGKLTQLQELNVECTQCSHDAQWYEISAQITKLTNLRVFHASVHQVSPQGIPALAKLLAALPDLEDVSFSDSETYRHATASVELAQALSKASRLSHITLSNFGVGPDVAQAVTDSLQALPELRGVTLQDIHTDLGDLEPLETLLQHMTHLQHLKLTDICCGQVGLPDYPAPARQVGALTALQTLCLSGLTLYNDSVRDLASQFSNLGCLKHLSLSGTYLRESGARTIAQYLGSLTELETLILKRTSPEDAGVAAIAAALAKLTALKHLDLCENFLTCAGASSFTLFLTKLVNLQTLDVATNQIRDLGGGGLADCIGLLPNLTAVYVQRNRIQFEEELECLPYVSCVMLGLDEQIYDR